MAIRLDIEDILGAACLSSIGRALSTLSCLWMGAATGSLSFLVAEGAGEALAGSAPDVPDLVLRALVATAWGPLLLFGSMLIPLFFPLVIMVYLRFSRGEGVTIRSWVILAGLTGFLVFISLHFGKDAGILRIAIGAVLWVGFVGSLGMLGFAATVFQRRRLGEHLSAVAAGNNERRKQLAEEFGTAVGDREFATGDSAVWAPRPVPERPHPKVPKPPRSDDHG